MRYALKGRYRLVYIAWSVQREPLDQTDLKNGGDVIVKVVENRHNNKADRWGPQGLGGPTCQRHVSRFGDSPFGVF